MTHQIASEMVFQSVWNPSLPSLKKLKTGERDAPLKASDVEYKSP